MNTEKYDSSFRDGFRIAGGRSDGCGRRGDTATIATSPGIGDVIATAAEVAADGDIAAGSSIVIIERKLS